MPTQVGELRPKFPNGAEIRIVTCAHKNCVCCADSKHSPHLSCDRLPQTDCVIPDFGRPIRLFTEDRQKIVSRLCVFGRKSDDVCSGSIVFGTTAPTSPKVHSVGSAILRNSQDGALMASRIKLGRQKCRPFVDQINLSRLGQPADPPTQDRQRSARVFF